MFATRRAFERACTGMCGSSRRALACDSLAPVPVPTPLLGCHSMLVASQHRRISAATARGTACQHRRSSAPTARGTACLHSKEAGMMLAYEDLNAVGLKQKNQIVKETSRQLEDTI